MVWIAGGVFLMGSNEFYPEEQPAHHVFVEGFWINPHPATTADFQPIRRGHGLRHRRRTTARPASRSPALIRPCSFLGRWCFNVRTAPCHCTTTAPGGPCPKHHGTIRKVLTGRRGTAITRSHTLRPGALSLTPTGLARICRLKPNGSVLPAEGWRGPRSSGVMSSPQQGACLPTRGKDDSLGRISCSTVSKAHHLSALFPRTDSACPSMAGNGVGVDEQTSLPRGTRTPERSHAARPALPYAAYSLVGALIASLEG